MLSPFKSAAADRLAMKYLNESDRDDYLELRNR